MLAMQNLGLTVVTIVAASIEVQYGYFILEMIFQALLFLALAAGTYNFTNAEIPRVSLHPVITIMVAI